MVYGSDCIKKRLWSLATCIVARCRSDVASPGKQRRSEGKRAVIDHEKYLARQRRYNHSPAGRGRVRWLRHSRSEKGCATRERCEAGRVRMSAGGIYFDIEYAPDCRGGSVPQGEGGNKLRGSRHEHTCQIHPHRPVRAGVPAQRALPGRNRTKGHMKRAALSKTGIGSGWHPERRRWVPRKTGSVE
jgi:hypothetical protein